MSATEKGSDQNNEEAAAAAAAEDSDGEVTTGGEASKDGIVEDDEEARNGEAGNEEEGEMEEEVHSEEELESDVETVSSEGKVSSADQMYSDVSPDEVPGEEDGPTYPYERASLEDRESLRPSESSDVEGIPTEPSGSSKQMGQDASRHRVSESVSSPGSGNAHEACRPM